MGAMHRGERFVWLAVTVVLLAAQIATASRLQKQVHALETRLWDVASSHGFRQPPLSREEPQADQEKPHHDQPAPADEDAEQAKDQPDLRRRLAADLEQHKELIPHEGVLGGTMGFYDPEGVRILGDRWVLAPFEDGHVSGQALLQYQLGKDGKIAWKLLDSYVE